jgi:hypothetical protein
VSRRGPLSTRALSARTSRLADSAQLCLTIFQLLLRLLKFLPEAWDVQGIIMHLDGMTGLFSSVQGSGSGSPGTVHVFLLAERCPKRKQPKAHPFFSDALDFAGVSAAPRGRKES